MSNKSWVNAVVIGVIIIALVSAIGIPGLPPGRLSLLPGFEGMQAGFDGFKGKGDPYLQIEQDLEYPYEWYARLPVSVTVHRHGDISDPDYATFKCDLQGYPQTVTDPYMEEKKVSYWIRNPDQKNAEADDYWIRVVGEVHVYSLEMSTEIISPSLNYQFHGEELWVTLQSNTWNKAYQAIDEQGSVKFGQAWEAPIAMVITQFELKNLGEHHDITPSLQGRYEFLYAEPGKSAVRIDDMDYDGDLNDSLSHEWAPDTRMKSKAYFPVIFDDFGPTPNIFMNVADWKPAANWKIKIYTFRLGKFTYTNPDKTAWEIRTGETEIPPWQQWMMEYLGWGGLGTIIFLVIIALVIIFLIPILTGGGRS